MRTHIHLDGNLQYNNIIHIGRYTIIHNIDDNILLRELNIIFKADRLPEISMAQLQEIKGKYSSEYSTTEIPLPLDWEQTYA